MIHTNAFPYNLLIIFFIHRSMWFTPNRVLCYIWIANGVAQLDFILKNTTAYLLVEFATPTPQSPIPHHLHIRHNSTSDRLRNFPWTPSSAQNCGNCHKKVPYFATTSCSKLWDPKVWKSPIHSSAPRHQSSNGPSIFTSRLRWCNM